MKKAFVTGATGQIGSYLIELLLEKGYEVHCPIRRGSTLTTERINNLLYPKELVKTYYGDLEEGFGNLIREIEPDEIYNLAAMSHVAVSFKVPVSTLEINTVGVIRLLEDIRRINPKIKVLQASSSEMFGTSLPPQNENTLMCPSSPYGASKLASYWLMRTYRDGYNMFCSNGIRFNSESKRRGKTFFPQKVVYGAVRIAQGKQDKLILGNLNFKRDWGHASDTAMADWMILQHDKPDDFVVATENQYTGEEFVNFVFNQLDLNWKDYISFDPRFMRPKEVPDLLGDATKIRNILGWKPIYDINMIIDEMIKDAWDNVIKNE